MGELPDGIQLIYVDDDHNFSTTQEDVNRSTLCDETNKMSKESQLAASLQRALRNGCNSSHDDNITILGAETDEEAHLALYKALVAVVGERAAEKYALSGRGISVARLQKPQRTRVIDPFSTYAFWSGVAPRVFSAGGGDITLATEKDLGNGLTGKRLQIGVWFEHLVWANTNRFAQHPVLPIISARLLMQAQARGQASFGLRQCLGDPTMSHEEIQRRMEAGDEAIFHRLFNLQGNVMGTAAFWAKFNKQVKASMMDISYFEQINEHALPPTLLFQSQSCAEYWWPVLHELFKQFATIHAKHDAIAQNLDPAKVSSAIM